MLIKPFRQFIFQKSWMLNIHQKHIWDWKVGMVNMWAALHKDNNSLTDMDLPEMDCPELTDKTADAVTDDSMLQLFVSTQGNNLDLCVKSALKQVIYQILF